ncbi:MAG: hypothetical protein ACRBCK_02535 [Alphaproteobacteria bacterium]
MVASSGPQTQITEQNPVDQNLDQIAENLAKVEADPDNITGNQVLLDQNETLLAQNDRLQLEEQFKFMFEEGVSEAGSYEAFVDQMQQKAAGDLEKGILTQAAYDTRLDVIEKAGNDPDAFATLAADSNDFMLAEQQKLQKDQNTLLRGFDTQNFMNDMENGNMMQAIMGLLSAFMSGEGLDDLFKQLQQGLKDQAPQNDQNDPPVQTADNKAPAQDAAASEPAVEVTVKADEPTVDTGVGGVNGNAVNYVMLDGPPPAGEPTVDFDGGQSTTLNSLFGSMATLDGASYMQTDAKVEPEIQVPFRAPEDAPALAQNDDVQVAQQMTL